MGRSEIRVTIDRPISGVFAVYTQADTWRWCSFLRSVRWVRGRPWEEESRLRLETTDPFGPTIDQVVMHFEPYVRIDYISHFGGVTLQTHVRFRALSENRTEVDAKFEYVGTYSRMAGFAIGTNIENRALEFYEDLRRECERVIPASEKD